MIQILGTNKYGHIPGLIDIKKQSTNMIYTFRSGLTCKSD